MCSDLCFPPLAPLIPVREDTKGHAYLRNWQKVSAKVLQEVMAKHPGCNVALRLDSFLALDPDSPDAVIFLGRLYQDGKLPDTVSWRSASGHITRLYRSPPGVKVKPVKPGSNHLPLELRIGRGQQCLIPPSQAPNRQGEMRRYEWIDNPWSTPMAVLPPETLKIIQGLAESPSPLPTIGKCGTIRKARKARHPSPTAPDCALVGQRNNFLFGRGRGLRGRGKNREEIEATLQEINRAKCSPPLAPGEVAEIAKSAASYPVNSTSPNRLLLRLTYRQVETALEALGGRERWIRRAILVRKIQELTGTPGNIIFPPVSVPTIERCLKRMVSKRLVSHRKGGWYKVPKKSGAASGGE